MEPEYLEEEAKNYQRLFQWGTQQGIYINPKLRYPVKFPPGYIGIQTTEDLHPGEVILTAPNHMMLSSKDISPPQLKQIYQANPQVFGQTAKQYQDFKIMTFLLYELQRGPESFWYQFLKMLPSDVDNLPDWQISQLREIQDQFLQRNALIRKEKDNKNNILLYQTLLKYPEIIHQQNISLQKINWCLKILCTRAFGRCTPDGALIPIADFFNHSCANTNYYYDTQTAPPPDAQLESIQSDNEDQDEVLQDSVKKVVFSCLKIFKINFAVYNLTPEQEWIRDTLFAEARKQDTKKFVQSNEYLELRQATKPVSMFELLQDPQKRFRVVMGKFETFPAGSPVTISYGRYSNRQLLFNYGFAFPENKYDYVRLLIPLHQILTSLQLQNLHPNYQPQMCLVYKLKEDRLNMDLIQHLRAILWRYQTHIELGMFNPIDYQLQLQVIARYQNLLSQYLQRFPTTVQEDFELKQAPGSLRHYFAVIFRKVVYRIEVKSIAIKHRTALQILRELINRMKLKVDLEINPVIAGHVGEELVVTFRKLIKEYIVLLLFHNTNQRQMKINLQSFEKRLMRSHKRTGSVGLPPKSHRASIDFSSQSVILSRKAASVGIVKNLSNFQLKKLYQARCDDLGIPVSAQQESKFLSASSQYFKNRKFCMKEMGLGFAAAKAIGQILASNPGFSHLDLSSNFFGDSGAVALVKRLKKNQVIVHIDLSSNDISPEGAKKVLKILKNHQSLVSLDLSSHQGLHRNRLAGCVVYFRQFLENSIIMYLNLAGTSLGDSGCQILAQSISPNTNLLSLNISNNKISSVSIFFLVNALADSKLIQLKIGCNKIANEGCKVLSGLLTGGQQRCRLECLDLSINGISSKGILKIFGSLKLNSSLKSLSLKGNNFSTGLSSESLPCIRTNSVLKVLNLSNCKLTDSGISGLLEGLSFNTGISKLNLSKNLITDKGATRLSESLAKNKILKWNLAG